jgi:steroid delta-isomerase-like uncharacterized protein
MMSLDIAKNYLDAWNARDADAIVKTFAAGGTYCDPNTKEIAGDEIAANAKRLWSAFPDLSFEIVSIAEAGVDRVVAEWIMKGTNMGAFQGLPPTGHSILVPGVDVIEIGVDGIRTVKGYFDTRAVPDQLGLQVLVQPFKVGPFSFGNSTTVQSGKMTKPGAFGITTIWNSDAQTGDIRALTRDIATEMLTMEGFIGVSFFRIGGRGVTISAWEKPEHTKQLMRGGNHSEAVRKFFADLADAGFTSVWVPDHINPLWVRCTVCRNMNDYEKNAGVCNCGQPLPDAPSYF